MPTLNTKPQLRTETLDRLVIELRDDCQTVTKLVGQFLSSGLTDNQKGEILAELLATAIHLQSQ